MSAVFFFTLFQIIVTILFKKTLGKLVLQKQKETANAASSVCRQKEVRNALIPNLFCFLLILMSFHKNVEIPNLFCRPVPDLSKSSWPSFSDSGQRK